MTRYEAILLKLGDILREERKKMGLSQTELGQRCKKPQTLIAKLERKMPPNVAYRIVYEIASALNMEVSTWQKKAEELADHLIEEEKLKEGLREAIGVDWLDFGAKVQSATIEQKRKLQELAMEISRVKAP